MIRFVEIGPLLRGDIDQLTAGLRAEGAVSIPGFLETADAQDLAAELESAADWVEIFRGEEKVYEMPQAAFLALDAARKAELQRRVERAARLGLQYRYRAIRVSEDAAERAQRGMLLDRFADLMNSAAGLALLRKITGCADIALADAQATDYRAGDFLTTHDDGIEGKNRLFAYVFSLTPTWRADWGGLLMFEHGERVSGFVPDFNVLRLFAVPSAHHVSYVAPWVEARRLSITGWLRAAGPAAHTGS